MGERRSKSNLVKEEQQQNRQVVRKKKLAEQKVRAKKATVLHNGRILMQIIFFIFAPSLFSQAFGGVKEICVSLGNGEVIVISLFVIRLIILCLVTIICGRIFCGWVCAFGAVGDWIYRVMQGIFKKIKIKPIIIPVKAVPYLQKLKFVVLVLILSLCFAGQSTLVTKYSPWTVFSLWVTGNFQTSEFGLAVLLLVVIVVGMALQERFFCQFLCPMGAIFSLLPEVPFFALKRKKETCIPNCQACRMQCPVKIKLDESPIADGECIRCGRCTTVCPKKNIQLSKQNSR